jgi:hypothetical protein
VGDENKDILLIPCSTGTFRTAASKAMVTISRALANIVMCHGSGGDRRQGVNYFQLPLNNVRINIELADSCLTLGKGMCHVCHC